MGACGLSPVRRVPALRLVTHVILVLSLVLNVGVKINLNHDREGMNMVKTTKKLDVAVRAAVKGNKAIGLGCVGKRARESG